MRKYERPLMIMQEFVANEAIATCGGKVVDFTCFRGGINDKENVLLDKNNGCTRIAQYQSGVTIAESDSKGQISFGNVQGLVYFCSKRNDNTSFINNEWHLENGILRHNYTVDKKKKKDTHDMNYHCMVAGVTNTTTVSTS